MNYWKGTQKREGTEEHAETKRERRGEEERREDGQRGEKVLVRKEQRNMRTHQVRETKTGARVCVSSGAECAWCK